ncbi:MAG: hypothetical protein GY823_02285 [Flavobacteriaceae bacterium]|nr:hypothetical protein [Flavobacteriaceae bacterium]
MEHSILNMFLTKGVLNRKLKNSSLSDSDEPEETDDLRVRNVCARMPEHMIAELETACSKLSCSKRQFIEVSIKNALSEYHSLAYEYDMTGERERQNNEEAYEEYIQERIEKGQLSVHPVTGEVLI